MVSDKRWKEYYYDYNHSPKGRNRRRKYNKTENCKKLKKEYEQSEKGKIAKKRYNNSLKGIEAKKRASINYKGSEKYFLNLFKKRSRRREKFPVKISLEDRRYIKQRDEMRCVYCNHKVFEYPSVPKYHLRQLTYDHIDSNGSTTPENLVISCWSCNDSKQDRNVFEWCKEKGFEVPKIIIELIGRGDI